MCLLTLYQSSSDHNILKNGGTTLINSSDPISSCFWPFDETIISWKYESSPILDNTCRGNIPINNWKVLNPFHALSNINYEMVEPIWSTLPAQYQASSDHLMELSIVGNVSLVQYWTTPAAVTSQSRPSKCWILFMPHLIYTMKWWNQFDQLFPPNIKQVLTIWLNYQ